MKFRFVLAMVAISMFGLLVVGCNSSRLAKYNQIESVQTQVSGVQTQVADLPKLPAAPVNQEAVSGNCLQEIRDGQLAIGDRLVELQGSTNLVATLKVIGKDVQVKLNAATGPHARYEVDIASVIRPDQVADSLTFGPADGQSITARLVSVTCGEVPVLHLQVSWFNVCTGGGVTISEGKEVKDLFSETYGFDACNLSAAPIPR